MSSEKGSAGSLDKLRETVLTESNLTKLLFRLALPLMLSTSISVIYEVADTLWLSRLSDAALGTPVVSWPLRGILMALGFGFSSSVAALAGQYAGAGLFDKASKSIGSVLGLLLMIVTPLSLLFAIAVPLYLDLISVPPDIRPLAQEYLTVLMLSTSFSIIFILFNFSMSALGDTKTPMKVSIIATLTNFVLDPILIFWAKLGVMGAALATAVANVLSAFYALFSFFTGRHGVKLSVGSLMPDGEIVPLVVKISTPITLQRLATTAGFITMARIVSGLGTPVVAAYSIGQVFLSLDRIISMPLGRAAGIIVSQSLGAGMIDRAKQAAMVGIKTIMSLIGLYVVLLLLFNKPFIDVFTDTPEVFESAHRMLVIFGPSVLGFTLYMLGESIARSSGHTVLVSALGFVRLWLLRIPLSYTLAYILGLSDIGLWTGMAVSNYVAGIAILAWILSWRWARPVIKR